MEVLAVRRKKLKLRMKRKPRMNDVRLNNRRSPANRQQSWTLLISRTTWPSTTKQKR
jgi:hypothetical protein